MRWPPWTDSNPDSPNNNQKPPPPQQQQPNPWTSLADWTTWLDPRTLLPTLILTSTILAAFRIHRLLRRFPDAPSISPSYFRRRTLFGTVTSVGDGDNFRLFHTPGGRLVGWGLLPWKKVPTSKKELKDNTVHIRLAGVDAPELPHFGRPEQPFAREAHDWLITYLLHRRVRAVIYRPDQYQRAVASVYVRRALDFPIPFRRRDVSFEMLRRGLGTVYEAKSGAEFGGDVMERKYRKAEWWAKIRGVGLWRDYRKRGKEWESPRQYKTRMGLEDSGQGVGSGSGNGHGK